jgi:hypothetical protein
LYGTILNLPEALMGDGFTAYSGRSSCFGLSHPNLVHPDRKLCLLGPFNLRPEEACLFVEEAVQGDKIGDHMIQNVIVMTSTFQVPHAGLPDWGSDSWGVKPHGCRDEVFLEDPAQVAEGFPDGQSVGVLVSETRGGDSPWFKVGVAGASGDGKDYPTAESTEVFVLSAVVSWAFGNTEAFQGVDQKARETRFFLANALGPSFFGHLKTKVG